MKLSSTKTIGKRPAATKMPKAAAVTVARAKPAKGAMKAPKAGKLGKGC